MCMQQVCVWVCMCVCVCVCVHSCACAYVFVIINLVNFENSKNYSPLISMHGCQPFYMGHYRMIMLFKAYAQRLVSINLNLP